MLIDFHTHAFPDKLAPRALHNLLQKANQYSDIYGPSQTYTNGTYNGLATSSKNAGFNFSVVMPIATSTNGSESLNNAAAKANNIDGLLSFGSVHPNSADALNQLDYIKSLGLKGIKLHPDYQDFYVDSKNSISVIEKATSLGLWVLLHAGQDVGFTAPFHCTPNRVINMYTSANKPKIILAHMGAYRMWQTSLDTFADFENIYVDTSNAIAAFESEWDVFSDIIKAFGSKRVIFGSDSPWADQKLTLDKTIEFLNKYNFSTFDKKNILGLNAKQILQI